MLDFAPIILYFCVPLIYLEEELETELEAALPVLVQLVVREVRVAGQETLCGAFFSTVHQEIEIVCKRCANTAT